jgi:5-methylcytosine-specific restriction endonuclease McrA
MASHKSTPLTPQEAARRVAGLVAANESRRVRQPCIVCGAPPRKGQASRGGSGALILCCSRECGRVYRAHKGAKARARKAATVGLSRAMHSLSCGCGVVFVSRVKSAKHCSPECRKASAKARYQARIDLNLGPLCKPLREVCCTSCGANFMASRKRTYCSPQCSKRMARRAYGKKARHRCAKRGVPHAAIDPLAVCKRDGWRCQLCGRATPARLRGRNLPNSPEVDHIVPLADPLTPGHVWSNVQCACRDCNIAKSSRPVGQLRIF